jgi:multidrug efflux pump subunit AcrA (membrane-fusion protein)
MTDRKALADQNETPEDVATLYSWANLHGAKYRDFSASRAQTREKARQRVQEAIEAERRRAQAEAEAQLAAEAQREAEAKLAAEDAVRQAELAERQAEQASAQQAAEREQAVRQAEQAEARQAVEREQAAQERVRQQPQFQQQVPPPQPRVERYSALPASTPASYFVPQPVSPAYSQPPAYVQPQVPSPAFRPAPAAPHAAVREESYQQPRSSWISSEARENSGRPAWLGAERTAWVSSGAASAGRYPARVAGAFGFALVCAEGRI